LTLKSLVKQVDAVAADGLPLARPRDEKIVAWADLHGWDVADTECQRLLVRQAVLNAAIRRMFSEIMPFTTPLDTLGLSAPPSLTDAIRAAASRSHPTSDVLVRFNFWGDLYNALIPQARRRRIGQFWTDEKIADWMVAWLLQFRPHYLADVGCGAGNFLLVAAQRLRKTSDTTELCGCDVSPLLLNVALAAFQMQSEKQPLARPTLAVQDCLKTTLPASTDAVVCNPPYTRHHHISPELKETLQAFFKARLQLDVSRQGTLAFYFLLKLITEMPFGARGAVIVPMEVIDARYGRSARRALCQHTSLTAMIHFAPQMNAFHKVDVGASILLFRKGYEKHNPVRHLTLTAWPSTDDLLACLEPTVPEKRELPFGSLVIQAQDDLLDVSKWFSIAAPEPLKAEWQRNGLVVPLKALVKIVRGIATGANDFFVLPTAQVKQRALEPHVVRTLQRNREVQDIILDEARWQALSDEGKGVWLLYLNGGVSAPQLLLDYLAEGEARGYHQRSLVQTRKRWYMMEQRDVPPIFFTILTRGNPRFILNRAGVRPLNMFSLIYPNRYVTDADATELLWVLLNSDFSLSRLHSVSRTYGGNTLKVEPRELDNLPVINPLVLPDDAQRRIREWIADFYRHQQTPTLMERVNGLVDKLLAEGIGTERSRLSMQLRLLDEREQYET
jgi:adenine-specific DNA-methyltransferase